MSINIKSGLSFQFNLMFVAYYKYLTLLSPELQFTLNYKVDSQGSNYSNYLFKNNRLTISECIGVEFFEACPIRTKTFDDFRQQVAVVSYQPSQMAVAVNQVALLCDNCKC